jgi:hypothetical protein
MFLSEATPSNFSAIDIFWFIITALIVVGLLRLLREKPLNKFGIGFATIALIVFIAVDFLVIKNWMGKI